MSEGEIQSRIMIALSYCPVVAWAHITTSGTVRRRGKFITVGIPGMPDIIGQLRSGKLFGIEVKTGSGKVSDEQQKFIDLINDNNGVSGIARSVDDALRILGIE